MNDPKVLTTIILFVIVFLLSFIGWHFFLSIYEVKFELSAAQSDIYSNSEYSIKCVGLNSLGQEIRFRDLECNFHLNEGEELVQILSTEDSNHFMFEALKAGSISILANSKYALNPTKIKYTVIK